MPELPEVETVVRTTRPRLIGRRIVAFESNWPRQVSPSAAEVRRRLLGRSICDVARRGKWIVWRLDDASWLLIHLRMSGRLEWRRRNRGSPDAASAMGEPRHVRASWAFDDGGRLVFDDARKFGRIVQTDDLAAATRDLGVEPLEPSFTPGVLGSLLRRRRRRLKPLLLDQSVVAGLGNIYADEALFAAGVHPMSPSDRLTDAQVRALHAAIRSVLRRGIHHNGATIDWVYPGGGMQNHFRVYGRTGAPCRRCGTAIRRVVLGQRSTHFCPSCQPRRGPRRTAAARRS